MANSRDKEKVEEKEKVISSIDFKAAYQNSPVNTENNSSRVSEKSQEFDFKKTEEDKNETPVEENI